MAVRRVKNTANIPSTGLLRRRWIHNQRRECWSLATLVVFQSSVTKHLETHPFLGNAVDLVNGLLKLRNECPLRPLLFVGHGLGGYLIKEVLSIQVIKIRMNY